MGTELCQAAMLRQEAKVRELESELAMLRAANHDASVDEQQIIDAPSDSPPSAIEQPYEEEVIPTVLEKPCESHPPQVPIGLGASPAYPRSLDLKVEASCKRSPPEVARLGQENSRTLPVERHSPQVEASSTSKTIHDDMMKALVVEIERNPRLLQFGQQAVSTKGGQYQRKSRLLQFGQQAVSTMAGQYRMLYGESDEED